MSPLTHVQAFLNADDGPAEAHALRAALRDLVAGRCPDLRVTAVLTVDATGAVVAVPDATGGHLLAAVHAAQADGSWSRLKLCAADDCARAFIDRSRNRSAQWCSMATCGNRAKVRAFRARSGMSGAPS